METHLADWLRGTPEGTEAESILRSCVHCGFCTATCPTYQLLGDELDGPRGRIYLMKQVMEGVPPTRETQLHLDRCLTCRNCESTCPSGVKYGHLVDIGRKLVDERVERPLGERLMRGALREGLTRRWLFDPAMRVGQALRPMLPESMKAKVPERRDPGPWPARTHARRVLMLDGCVQPAMIPAIDAATARVLDALGIEPIVAAGSGCCGAIRHHLNDHGGALGDVRRNIDVWWPHIEGQGVEAIVVNASGCGAMLADYGHLLRDDPAYAQKAARVSSLVRDLSVFLASEREALAARARERADARAVPLPARVAFHPPCTLQHGQQVRGAVEALLTACGAELQPFAESHLCCGSAGTYSVMQPTLSKQLRDRKLENLEAGTPETILSANIGCLTHLQSGTGTPVRHWIEWVDRAIGTAVT
ncbi:MAG: glycolate oxidase iron-sulfur subunit [Burkholderiales bacterium]|nr:MAG: glycolate oxidase iron-sulfur subunit [Burkholderiales bacterium]